MSCPICHAPDYMAPDYYPEDVRRDFYAKGEHRSCVDPDACEAEYHNRAYEKHIADTAALLERFDAMGQESMTPEEVATMLGVEAALVRERVADGTFVADGDRVTRLSVRGLVAAWLPDLSAV